LSLSKSVTVSKFAASILAALLITSLISSAGLAQNEATVSKRVRCLIDIYGLGPVEFTDISGPCQLLYTDPYDDYDGHIRIDTEIISMDLRDQIIFVSRNDEVASPGGTRSIEPGIDFPAESFFDVMYKIELPEQFPGDYLINYEPMHMMSLVDQFPPYFAHYIYAGAPIILYSTTGIDVAAILEWEESILPYYPPKAHITCPSSYKSDVAILNEDGLIELPASCNGMDDEDIDYAEFGYRPFGDPGMFVPFYTDFSGAGTRASTHGPVGEGDGWCGYFDPGSEPFEGQVAEFRVRFFPRRPGPYIEDTCSIWIDSTPPIPWIFPDDKAGDPETLRLFQVDSFFDIMFTVPDEMPGPGPAELQVFPLTQRFERTLTVVDQLSLGTDLDSTSCGPAAAASCLKYFADNGYPTLDNPGGDEAKPEQSGEDIARELQGAMGTNAENGTSGDGMVSGIESYLDGHGQSGWSVSGHPVESDADLAAMFREFEADSEDVIVLLQDTTTAGEGAGDTTGHWVTLGSREQTRHSADSTSQKIDFMDPWGGGSTADNNYDVGEDENGNPTTDGYDLDGAGGDAVIAGYIKVSPPEDGAAPGLRVNRAPGTPAFDPDWIPVDAGTVRGNGLVDTLHWDTHGFMPGLYLMEVITTNHQGHTCRDIRLALLTEPSTGSDPGTPGLKTGLRGTYPNPFNPATNIVFSLEKGAPVTLVIYDIAGRRVRTLMNAKMTEAGSYTVPWDGVDDRGGRVSSGVYFCRFTSWDAESSTKMILLR
jgi:hypothetical protein